MNRTLLTTAVLIGGTCLGSALISAPQDPQPVQAHDYRAAADRNAGRTPSATVDLTNSGQRDYRRELLYDSSILKIRSQLHGIARPQMNAVMSSLVPGQVMTIHQQEGAVVKAGEKLVSLDDRLAQAQVEAARAEAERVATLQKAELAFQQSERRLERLKQAGLQSASAGFEIEEARSLMEQARADRDMANEAKAVLVANLKMAEEQLRRNTVFAPFDSVVVQVHQKVGTTVDPSLPLITLADLATLEVEMYVPVDRFGTLQTGGTVKVLAGEPVSKTLTAAVRSVSPVIDSASNTFRCVLVIDNSSRSLPAGFSVELADDHLSDPQPVAVQRDEQGR